MKSTNFIDGVTNATESSALGGFPAPSPVYCHYWFDDFDRMWNTATGTASDWMLTTTGSGTAIVTQADGGVALLTNGATDNNNVFLQWKGGNASAVAETFRWAANKNMWFAARFKVSDATLSDAVIGLQIADTSPLDVTDGLFFIKSEGSTTLTFRAEKNDTASTVTVGTLANDTYVVVAFVWDAEIGVLTVYLNDTPVGRLTSTTNFPDDEDLAVSIGIQNGEGASKTMSVDYILVAKER